MEAVVIWGRQSFRLFYTGLLAIAPLAGHAECPGSETAKDQPSDLEVSETCTVGAGSYFYRNVNIKEGGTLDFQDAVIDFHAASIVIENKGRMTAGTPSQPIGSAASPGQLTIHLYGGPDDPGVSCASGNCGIPDTVWISNPLSARPLNPSTCNKTGLLPGKVDDCFYQYDVLPQENSYFGHKVLAVSYGGTLALYGKRGALNPDGGASPAEDRNCESQAACSGRSWVRLQGSLKPGDTALTVDGRLDWQDQDRIVVTTTDYLPGHSEELIIKGQPSYDPATKLTTMNFEPAHPKSAERQGVYWPHNGMTYPIPANAVAATKLNFSSVETRAAVGLLSHSIRIVSDGSTPGSEFTEQAGNHFGGHLIARQGFEKFQIKGVEFRQLGQGGILGRYAVHFHLARKTPPNTYVKDSSVNESMTRWFTIHGTHGVTLERNVGYLSIGHGFYLEDATEVDNKLNANLGIFARAAIDNDQNPRKVPGILASRSVSGAVRVDEFGYQSDYQNPSVFWIMNGWNDFKYNVAAGAGSCGACYWLVPGANSGPSAYMKWEGYAAEQKFLPGFEMQSPPRAGMTPLKDFVGNSCVSAMHAFQVTGRVGACQGLGSETLPVVPNPKAPDSPSDLGQKVDRPDSYYPVLAQTGTRFATRCPEGQDCSEIARCSDGSASQADYEKYQANCDVTVLDQFTTSFNWARPDTSAVWLRNQWALFTNSAITDVQGAGLTMVTGGGYSKSDVITGYWGLARKNVLIGDTQFSQIDNPLRGNPLAANAGPFNPLNVTIGDKPISGLKCSNGPNQPNFCTSLGEGVTFQLSNFLGFQRLFNVYDGPSYQDSNVYLSIHPTELTGCTFSRDGLNTRPCLNSGWALAEQVLGPRKTFPPDTGQDPTCYLPNAAIGWKQANGFYYPPAFHSRNLYFGDDTSDNSEQRGQYGVGIRHYVIEPLYEPGTLTDSWLQVYAQYCNYNPGTQPFTSVTFSPTFTAIDRMTVLNDDDGSLTGLRADAAGLQKLKPTLSINTDTFFEAPEATSECASDRPVDGNPANARNKPATAFTSPYQYVSTVIYPACADNNSGNCPGEKDWARQCSDPNCYGVPLYRQLLTTGEAVDDTQQVRMMGQDKSQRSSLTVNHGIYYIDTTKDAASQSVNFKNVFQANDSYYLFFLYAKATTRQTYQVYVGQDPAYDVTKNVQGIRVNIPGAYQFSPLTPVWPTAWTRTYHPDTGMLEVTIDMDSPDLKGEFNKKTSGLGKELCQPASMCSWDDTAEACRFNPQAAEDPRFKGPGWTDKDRDAICAWSVRDYDCPKEGCLGFRFKMSGQFLADNSQRRSWSYVDAKGAVQSYPRAFSAAPDPKPWEQNTFCRPVNGEPENGQCYYASAPGCPDYPKKQ